ncbi:Glycosaminoglycan attachment site [hydrothermal vent metagenome]|uniref:Glycosaminoglycan attachment site n=1 Tax=hydrothermal vent metagenome TaxID=652676 RepID=A0A3B0XAP9_9ZZZZ
MQEIIDSALLKLVRIIESKQDSRKVAWQFVLEELDAAKDGNDFVRDRIKSFYINSSDYLGAMSRSWSDVDGSDGPQQFLLALVMTLSERVGIQIAATVRISIVEYIIHHYKFGRYFVNDKIKLAKNPLNLFHVIANETKLNANYKSLMLEESKPIRDVICRWASGFEDRDNKFNHEFQTTFNSSFWEIYLYQCFKDLNLSVDFSKASPDFTLKSTEGAVLNVEAVTANHAHDSEPEWSNSDSNISDHKKFLDFACVRILNAIKSKHEKYLNTYSKYDHVKDNPYVIAIAPFEQRFFFMQNNEAIIRVLYGQGVDSSNQFKEVKVPTVLKNSSIPLELGVFTNDKYKEVSAVIFSTIATIGKAITQSDLERDIRVSRFHEINGLISEFKPNDKHFETHLDGLQVHHNPYATIKLNPDLFNKYEVTHYYYNVESEAIDIQQKSYTIISRNTFQSSKEIS